MSTEISIRGLMSVLALGLLWMSPVQADEVLRDVQGHGVDINPTGSVTLVVYTNADLEEETREFNQQLDPLRGDKGFRIVRVVDLRGEVPPAARKVVRKKIREEEEADAKRAEKLYQEKGNRRNPRSDLATVADFSGGALRKLGWDKWSDEIRVVVFNQGGKEAKRQTAPEASALVPYLKGLLEGKETAANR